MYAALIFTQNSGKQTGADTNFLFFHQYSQIKILRRSKAVSKKLHAVN